ncbi:fibroblast growth factor receptor 4-like [Xenia sp. Carnegie-2017]|uniref:fibroblast growth factor receptor 4-like n=1 Tax=Xenia sp. Carnegie-2017 TaxID=2897299 RepID=UPI001F04C0D2|nr:fibroblast growth factor receptor 4-like [Xenia sp. Carnegie-2017]
MEQYLRMDAVSVLKVERHTCTLLTLVALWCACSAEAPKFTAGNGSPENKKVKNGSKEERLRCSIEATSADYKWFKNDVPIKSGRKYRIKPFKYLKIKNVRFQDQGQYRCEATNDDGHVEKIINLTVYSDHVNDSRVYKKPYFTKNVSLVITYKRKDKRAPVLDCTAGGYPKPTIIWYKGSEQLKNSNNDGSTLRVKSPDSKTNAKYKCIVSNGKGAIQRIFTVTIEKKTRSSPVMQDIKNHTVVLGDTIAVECKAVNRDKPEFQLLRVLPNGTEEVVKIGGRVTMIDSGKTRETTLTWHTVKWTFENVSLSDAQKYACAARNEIGTKKENFWLFVISEVPERPAPHNPKVTPSSTTRRTKTTKILMIIGISVGATILFLVIVIAMCYRHKRTSKLSFDNNWYPLEEVIPNTIQSYQAGPSKTRLRLHSNMSQTSEIPYDDDWDINRENVRLLGTIGEGAFGRVLKAEAYVPRLGSMRLTVAVKTLKDDATDVEFADLVSELEVMKKIGRHKNIINLIGCCTQNGPPLVVVEYAPHGNLREYLRDRRPQRPGVVAGPLIDEILSLRDFISFSYQVARGMEYLASMKCIHRDLAARNVLVWDEKVMKIADFGLARDIHKIDYYRKTTDGRLPVKWMALEALFDRVYTIQSDVWAFGVLAWEIFTFGGTPYPSVPLEKLFELLKSGYRMERPPNCPPELYDLLLRCWQEEPASRPHFSDIVKELNDELVNMTTDEYVDVELPMHSPMTPRTLSESEPNHGLSSVPTAIGNNVFTSEENDIDEEEELLEKDCDNERALKRTSSDSGLIESELLSDGISVVDGEQSELLKTDFEPSSNPRALKSMESDV